MTPVHELTPLEAATFAVAKINDELFAISGDMALLLRLNKAEASSKRLKAELVTATAKLGAAQTADALASRKASHARFGAVTITAVPIAERSGSALSCNYRIEYEIMEYDGRTSNLVPKHTIGFNSLPTGLYEYIIDEKSHCIPTVLLSLASDPAAAMNVYFKALAKGYLEG
ncbi:hypothetical protein [Polymorphobacter megasporae]|uniref:hypothetical protein n=1 Tax=Glacieibacterium megasporae TaxID=2835787 RepID=UPI001C1DCEE0|nr:hypothetical protein [Polymorphobacter megasporae]UAJ09248.1 hypothetical protein KTC28_13030 [Polymorphobacter megasporae]